MGAIVERKPLRIGWSAILIALPGAWGQTLQVPPQTAVPGEWVTLEIRYQPPAGRELAGLQWDLEIPPAPLDAQNPPVARAPLVVKEAEKSAACSAPKTAGKTLLVTCLLGGSRKPIPTGTILLFSLKLSDRAQPGPWNIRIQHGMAVDAALQQTAIEPVDAVLTIRAR